MNKHYPVWWIEELYRVWGGVLASLNRRGTLDDLERCRVFRPLSRRRMSADIGDALLGFRLGSGLGLRGKR